MCHGSRSEAIELIKQFAKSQPRVQFEWNDDEFDDIMAELFGGGCEIEWETE